MAPKVPSAKPTYTLRYFNIRGLAEPIRYLLAYGKIEYKDDRVTREEWPALKDTMPMGQMPVLEIDGIVVHQCVPICRYLGKVIGLAGANDWESLQIDIATETINDLRQKIIIAHFEKDEAAKAIKTEQLTSETIPFYLGKLEVVAKENNGHLALSKFTWVDFYFGATAEMLNVWFKKDILETYPNLQAVANNINGLQQIKDWVAKRPKTDM